jgi:hypothetical protein
LKDAPFKSSRLKQLVEDVFSEETGPSAPAEEWPHSDYSLAAKSCGDDRLSLEKLRGLCDDLESVVSLRTGPGSLSRLAGVPIDALKPLEGLCWREILMHEHLGRLAWLGLRNYGSVLKSGDMDHTTRRTGAIIYSVAVSRLERIGEIEPGPVRRRRNLELRKMLLKKTYLPLYLARILST